MTFTLGFIVGFLLAIFLVILLKSYVEYYKWRGRKILDFGRSILQQREEIEKQLKEINNGG